MCPALFWAGSALSPLTTGASRRVNQGLASRDIGPPSTHIMLRFRHKLGTFLRGRCVPQPLSPLIKYRILTSPGSPAALSQYRSLSSTSRLRTNVRSVRAPGFAASLRKSLLLRFAISFAGDKSAARLRGFADWAFAISARFLQL